jgi:hypothetical protein
MRPLTFQAVVRCVDIGHGVDVVERVEGERPGELRFGIGRRKLLRIEDEGLGAIVQPRDGGEKRVDRFVVAERAAGQHREAAEREHLFAEQSPRRHAEFAARVDEDRLAVELARDDPPGRFLVLHGHGKGSLAAAQHGQ